MTVYLGNLGQLVPIKCPSSQSVESNTRTTFEETLEGKVKAQTRALRARRRWSVGLGAGTPADLAAVLAFDVGEFGAGPFVWVSADAPVTNMLTPEVSTMGAAADVQANASVSGPLRIAGEGLAGRSLSNSDATVNLSFGNTPTPVLPSEPVTASAGLIGLDAQMGVSFWTSTGAYISAALSPVKGVAAEARRISVTATAPADAAYCLVYGYKTVKAARPTLTWTDQVFDWQPGEGCPRATLSGVSKDVVMALREPKYGRYSNLTATITEVG